MTWSDYISIAAIIISVPSLILSFKTAIREKRRGEYDKKLQILFQTQALLETKQGHSSTQKISSEDEKRIKIEICALFGEKMLEELDKILSLCIQANQINYEIGILLETLFHDDPVLKQRYDDVLLSESEYDLSEAEHKENVAFLKSLRTKFLQEPPGSERREFDYFELNSELNKLTRQISDRWNRFETTMKTQIKFN